MTVEGLIGLRNRTLDDYVDGRTSADAHRADLSAIAVELDRLVSVDGEGLLEDRAARVVAEILADSRARNPANSPARVVRLQFWHRRRLEHLRREDPDRYEAELREQAALDAAEPDEVRMARPILAALGDQSIARGARDRVRAIADRPLAEGPPARLPAFPDVVWTDDDRLTWEEFIGGVPCQGCGHAFVGDDTSQRDGESWSAYRVRMEPIEAEFKSSHPDHGTRWTVGGGPFHCRRCCAPHPLSPEQIRQISQIMNRQTNTAVEEKPVPLCGTCHKPIEANHVCQLADLPRGLRAVVEAVLEQERAQATTVRQGEAEPPRTSRKQNRPR
jgi:hypothetical protein